MLDPPQITRSVALLTAIIRLSVPRAEIQNVMGPGMGELMAGVGPRSGQLAYGAEPATDRQRLTDRSRADIHMSTALNPPELQSRLRSQLADRRARLYAGNCGLCAVCDLSVDEEDLLANPMASYCLCKLSAERQRALERDLDLAWHVQAALLPKPNLAVSGWQTHCRYLPYGPVSGDCCDLVVANGAWRRRTTPPSCVAAPIRPETWRSPTPGTVHP
jgi:RNA polymerase-binding transcription factor DksA